jgi:hypothetical protein
MVLKNVNKVIRALASESAQQTFIALLRFLSSPLLLLPTFHKSLERGQLHFWALPEKARL